MRPQIQEVSPHAWEVEGRPGGLQAWGRQNGIIGSTPRTVDTDEGQQTVPKETPRTRVWERARPNTPSKT